MKKILVLTAAIISINSYASSSTEPQLILSEHLDKMPALGSDHQSPNNTICQAWAYNTTGVHDTAVPISGAYGYNMYNTTNSTQMYYLDVYQDVNGTNVNHYKWTFQIGPGGIQYTQNPVPINSSMNIHTPGKYPVTTTTMISGAGNCKISANATVNVT